MIRIIFCLLFDEYRKSADFKAESRIFLNKIFCKKSLFHEFYPIFGLFGLIIMAIFLRCRPVNAYKSSHKIIFLIPCQTPASPIGSCGADCLVPTIKGLSVSASFECSLYDATLKEFHNA